jgi:hypothetical protein
MGVEEPLRVRCQSDQHPTAAGPSIIRSLGGCSYGFRILGGCSYDFRSLGGRSYLERGRVGF